MFLGSGLFMIITSIGHFCSSSFLISCLRKEQEMGWFSNGILNRCLNSMEWKMIFNS